MKNFFYDKRILVLYIITILLLIIGTTFALQSTSLGFNINTSIVKVDETAYGSTTFDSSNLDFKPILDTDVESSTDNVISIDFKVGGNEQNNNNNIIYDIALTDLELNCELLSPYLKWKLVKNGTEISSGSLDYQFDTIVDGRLVLTTIQQDLPDYSADEVGYDDYQFYLWLSDSCQDDISTCISNNNLVDQSSLVGKNLSGKIEVELYTEGKKELVRNPKSSLDVTTCQDKYLVEYVYNGGIGTETSKYVTNGTLYGTLPTPSKDAVTVSYDTGGAGNLSSDTINYTFGGWYLSNQFKTEELVTKDTTVSENVNHKLYAKWSEAELTLPNITRTGYILQGWYSDSSFNNKVGNAGATYNPSKSITLYAKWTVVNEYTVTYDYSTNGGTSATKTTDTVADGSAVDLTPTATKSGWTFVGWNTDQNATSKLNSLTMSTSNVTLYAIYKKVGQVTFNLNGNTSFTYSGTKYTATTSINLCTMYNNATTCQASVTMPTIEASSNTPTIIGWSNAADTYTGTYTSGQSNVTLTSGTTWYAQTKKDAVTLNASFNANGATLSSTEAQSCTLAATYNGTAQNTSCTVTAPTITRSGYTIVGFNTSASSTSNNSAYSSSTGKITLTSSNTGSTWFAITYKKLTATFYYYNSGVKNTSATCNMYNTSTNCTVTVPLSTFNSTTAQYGGTYVGYGAVNTMGTTTSGTTSISQNTNYYVSYRKNVTEYYQNTSRTIYRNEYFTSTSAMSTVLSTSNTGTSNLSTASYTASSITWSWYGYATSSSTSTSSYSTVASAATSTTTTLYTLYSRSVTATFYYYNGSAQATTTASGTQLANYQASVLSNGSISIPSAVTSSTGPNNVSYSGLSTSTSSATTTTTINTSQTNYYAIYVADYTASFTKENSNVSSIGSTSLSCSSKATTNGTTYSTTDCSITLPTITPASGYTALGWYNSSGTLAGQAGTIVNITSNQSYIAKAKRLIASEFSYDNSDTGVNCTDVQCMIDKLDIPMADQFSYDNSETGVECTDIQCMIDKLDELAGG